MGHRVLDVGEIAARGAASVADQRHGLGERQLARELAVRAVGEIDQRRHGAAIVEMDRPDRLLVDAVIVDLAMDQVAAHRVVLLGAAGDGRARGRSRPAAGRGSVRAAWACRDSAPNRCRRRGASRAGARRASRAWRSPGSTSASRSRRPRSTAAAARLARSRWAHAWLRWISARRISRVRVNSSNSLSPSPQRMARCR